MTLADPLADPRADRRFEHRLAAASALGLIAATLVACGTAPPGPRADSPVILAPAQAADIVLTAMGFLGVDYQRGGAQAENGFDCSGFTRHVYERSLGLTLPRTAAEQANHDALQAVSAGALQPGDLVFFNTLRHAHSHVGIYIGQGRFIHAPRPGLQVRLEDMQSRYWVTRFDGARRARAAPILGEAGDSAPPQSGGR